MDNVAFISMPYGENPESSDNVWTKLFEYGIKPLSEEIEGVEYEPLKLLRADKELADLGLKQNVIKLIEQSTIVIGVLTTETLGDGDLVTRLYNPNVFWELGFAEALGKPVVVLAANKDARSLPVLAGDPNVCLYNHKLVEDVSTTEAPTSLQKITRDLIPYVIQAVEDSRSGYKGQARTRVIAYANRDHVDLAGMIASATKQVDILTTNVGYFLSKYFFNAPAIEAHPFSSALRNGVTVRIVTMDPESVIAEYRAKQLRRGDHVPGYRAELRNGIIELYKRHGHDGNFHLHLYNDLPLQITIRVDETIITSVVTRGDRARKRIQIKFSEYYEGVTESFVSHFQSMYEDSKDVKGVAWVIRRPDLEIDSAAYAPQDQRKAEEERLTKDQKPRGKM